MSDIRSWLERHGLGKYVAVFVEHEVDLEALPHLTEGDLREMGLPIGPRRKALAAIGELATQGAPEEGAPGAGSVPGATEAERRQLTVMFCDLAGSTSISESMDPEGYREILSAYQSAVRASVARFDGFIARYMGDGVLVYFGYPYAHEDDAERSVRAGLDIVEGVSRLGGKGPTDLRVRIGIATGLVVAGDIIGEGASEERAVLGDTPNLAARLQSLAEPGSVLVSGDTYRLCSGFFEWESRGSRELKGFSQAFDCWAPRRALNVSDRFDAQRGASLVPFAGRRAELALLLDAWEEVKGGDGRVVLISGEAGIGKSRLVQHFREQIASDDFVNLRYQAAPFYSATTLYPVIQQLRAAARFSPEDDDETRLEKLEAMLSSSGSDLAVGLPLIADLLGVSAPGRYPEQADLTPEQRKRQTLRFLESRLHSLASRQPVLCVFEDAHWSDPTTIEMLDRSLGGVARSPILFVITLRPEFETRWGETFGHARSLVLNALGRQDVTQLVRSVCNDVLDPGVVERVVAQTDGIPLFAEELTRGLLETASDAVRRTEIPSTLQASLLSRLDNLGSLKELAQVCAVIGREFDADLVAEVVGDQRVRDELGELVGRRLVYRERESTYVFKHALIQEAAYSSLLNARRQRLHRQIADTLNTGSERFEARPEILGHHYSEARAFEQAVPMWRDAARAAIHRAANREAVGHLLNAITAMKQLPEDREHKVRELELMLMLGPAHMAVRGYASAEAALAFGRAHELAREVGEPEQHFTALWNRYYIGEMGGQWRDALPQSAELLEVARTLSDSGAMVQAHHAALSATHCHGQIDTALEHVRALVALYDEHEHRMHKFQYGAHDPAVCAYNQGALLHTLAGFPDQGLACLDEANRLADRIGHHPSKAHVLLWATQNFHYRLERERTYESALETIGYCEEHRVIPILRMAEFFRDWAADDDEGAHERLCERVRSMRSRSRRGYLLPCYAGLAADVCRRRGEVDEGLAAVEYGLQCVAEQSEFEVEAELHRLRAVLLLARGDVPDAAAALDRSAAVAAAQNARLLQLRTACSQVELERRRGDATEARERLRRLRGAFTEGFGIPDIRAADALLASPASG